MKVVFNRESFLNSFITASSVVKSNNAKAILCNIKMEATSETVVLMAGDSEIRLRTELSGVQVEEPGAILLPPARVRSVLSESKAETVQLESSGTNVVLTAAGSKFTFPTDDPQDFPPVDAFVPSNCYIMAGKTFVDAVHKTAFASDINSGRAVFGGVLISIVNGSVNFVATDTRRMAHFNAPIEVQGNTDQQNAAVVPKLTIQLAERIFSSSDNDVQFEFDNNRIVLSNGISTLYAQLVEGTYPDWTGIFKKTIAYELTFNTSEFLSSVKQAGIVSTQDYPGIELVFENNVLTLSGHSPDNGDSLVTIAIDFPDKSFQTKLGPDYIIEFLRVLESNSEFCLQLIEGNNPVMFKPSESLEYAIMPLSIK